MFMVLLITLYLLCIQKKSIMFLYLYSLPNENCLIVLCIKEKLQKDINCLPTWYFISEAKILTYATTIKVEMSKLHKIKPQKRETIATGSVTLLLMEMGKIVRGMHLEGKSQG